MKATKKLLMIGLMLLVLTGLTVFFSISASAADVPVTDDANLLVFENKVYDGTDVATVDVAATLAKIQATYPNITGVTVDATFADKNVADGKAITVNSVTFTSSDSDTYIYAAGTSVYAANITPKTLYLNSLTLSNKVYDASTALADGATLSPVFNSTGLLTGDSVGVALATGNDLAYANKNVGIKNIVNITADDFALTGADKDNYVVAIAADCEITSEITVKEITIDSLTVADRPYDSTTDGVVSKITVNGVTGTLSNNVATVVVCGTEELNINLTATFGNKNVEYDSANEVTTKFVGVTASISDSNYKLVTTSVSANAKITPATLTVKPDAGQKVVYGEAMPVITYTYAGNIAGETPMFTGALAKADAAILDAGTYDIELGDLAIVNNSPFLAGNYKIELAPETFEILARKVTISGLVDATHVYDGATYVYTVTGTETFDGLVGSAKVTAGTVTTNGFVVGDYKNADVVINITGMDGDKLSNYTFVLGDAEKLTITQRTVTITGINATKEYDATVLEVPLGDINIDGIAATDTVAAGKLVTNDWLKGTYSSISGAQGASKIVDLQIMNGTTDVTDCYTIDAANSTIVVEITAKKVTLNLIASKEYNGQLIDFEGATVDNIVIGDVATVVVTTTSKMAGTYTAYPTDYTVKSIEIERSGRVVTDCYEIIDGANVALTITKKAITIDVNADKVFDADSLVAGADKMTSTGLITGDVIFSGEFETNDFIVGTYTTEGIAGFTYTKNADAVIKDGEGNDVSSCYDVSYVVSLEITKKPLEIIITANKVYNGTVLEFDVVSPDPNFITAWDISYGTDKGLANGDALTAGKFTTTGVDAGKYTVETTDWTVAGLDTTYGIGNYDVTYNVTLTIDKNKITIDYVDGIADMIYNGGTDLPAWGTIGYTTEVALDSSAIKPVITATDVNWSAATAGTNTVVLEGLAVTVADPDNFEITYVANTAVPAYTVYDTETAEILKATVTVQYMANVPSKYYDGDAFIKDALQGGNKIETFNGTSIVAVYTLNTVLVSGVDGPVVSGSIVWVGKDAATPKNVNISALSLSDDVNFVLSAATYDDIKAYEGADSSTKGSEIKKIVLTPYLASVDGKIYDGNAATQNAVLEYDYTKGLPVAGEEPTYKTFLAKWISVMAGTKLIDVTGIALDDAWLTNYELSTDTLDDVTARDADATDVISVRTIIITATANKVYDKTTLSVAYDKFVADNLVNVTGVAVDGFTAGVFTTTGVNAGMYETKDTEWTGADTVVITATTPHADAVAAGDPADRTVCYDIKYVDASDKSTVELEIKTRPIHIESDEKHIIYGDARPVYTWSIINTVDEEDLNKLLAKFDINDIILDCNYAPGSAVGEYVVKFIKKIDDARLSEIVKAAGLNYEYDNYEFTDPAYVENDVNVYKKDLALFIEDLEVMYSKNAPAVEGYNVLGSTATYALPFDGTHYTVYKADGTAVKLLPAELESTADRPLGFVAGDNFSNVIGYAEFKLTTTYGAGSGVGQGDLANGNYSVNSTTALALLKADNYTVVAYSATEDIGHGEIEVTPFVLTVTPENLGKLYGETDPAIVPAEGIIAHLQAQLPYPNQTLTVNGTPTLVRGAGETVGDYTFTLTVELLTSVNGAGITFNANNYTVELATDANGNDVVFTIAADKVTISGVVGTDKTYDGTVDALGALDLSGLKVFDSNGDEINVAVLVEAVFADKNVGTDKVVTLKFTLDHTDPNAQYYIVDDANCQLTTTADITPKALTVTGIIAQNKTYDGTTTVVLDLSKIVLDGLVEGDSVSFDYYMARFESAKANDTAKVVFDSPVLTGADKKNYTLTVDEVTAQIARKTIYLTDVVISNKIYDATTDLVNPAVDSFAFNNDVVGDDEVAIELAGAYSLTYASKNVAAGVQKLLGVDKDDFVLIGKDADNYTLAISDGCEVTSSIEKATITIDSAVISNKVYDGTLKVAADATITVTTDDVFAGDVVLFAIAAGNDIAYEDINVNGQAIQNLKNLTADDIVLSGADAGNYEVAIAGGCTVESAITPRGITISGITAKNKDYDGTATNIEFVYDKVATDFLVVVDGVKDIVNVKVKSYTVVNGGNAGHTTIELELEIDNPNYFINVGSQTKCEIDIYKINVTITVKDQTIIYGNAADFTVDTWSSQVVTGSGFVAVTPSTWVAEDLVVDYKLITDYVNAAGDPNRVVGSYFFTIEYVDVDETNRVKTNYNVIIEAAEIIVEKRTLVVTPDNAAIIYGDSFTNSDINVVLTNWAYGEDATTVTFTGDYVITTTYENVAGSANRVVGTYGFDLTASTLEAENYDFDYTATAEVEVAKRTVTVSVDPTEITYGDAIPEYVIKFVNWAYDEGTATGSDLISHDSWLGVSVTNPYEQGNNAGAYPYTFNGAYYALQNYEFDYQPGELTVNKRQITVTANDKTIVYGDDAANAGYTLSGDGFYGEDVIGEVTYTYVDALGNAYVAGSNIGDYAIVPYIEDTTNYDYTCVNGTLTVTPKTITLTLKDHTIEYRAEAANAGFDGLDQILAKDVDSFAFNYTYGTYTVGSPVGTYTITLSYTANANYTVSAESDLEATLTVVTRKITVTPAHGNLVYGAEVPADGYTYDWNYKDMLTTDSVTFGGEAVYATTYTQGATAKNTYVITVTGLTLEGEKAANYEIVYAEGTQTVDKAALTINITGEIFYGDDLPTEYTVNGTGFVLGETLENLGGELVITVPTYTKGNDAGSYAIVASGYTSDNYEITYNAANALTVKKVVINGVVDTPATIVYGDAEPTFTVTFDWSTLVNGDTKDALKGYVAGTITSTYDVADPANRVVGNYPITAAGYEATNYEFVITGATLKVDPKPITLNAKDYTGSVIYGSDFPIDDLNDTYIEILSGALVYGETFATSDIVFRFTTEYIAGNDTDDYTFVAEATSTNYAITWNNDNGKFTVSPKILNFTIDATTNVIYGNQPDYSGVINWNEADFFIGDTVEDLVGSITVRATGYGAGSPVGTYPITVKINLADDGNYVVCYNGVTYADAFEDNTIASLVVLKRNIHISANDAETVYYSAAPEFGYTVAGSGIAPNDTLADVFGQIKFTCTYGAGASVGEYAIVITTEKTSDNYELVREEGTLTVTPKIIYIMPDADSKFVGEADPTFTFTYSGNIAGETPKFTGKLTREEGEAAGLYYFECDELGLADNAPFYAENYKLALDPNAPQFEIFGDDNENAINVKLEGAGVDLLDEIHLYYVFSINNPNGLEIAEMGLLQWTADEYAALASYGYDAKYAFTNGYAEGDYYFYNGQSIDATKYMDTYYARAYVKLANGDYVYSKVMAYSVTDYAKTILSSEATEHVAARSVVIAMLDYGTAVMKFRGMTDAGYPSDVVSAANRTEHGKVYEDTLKVPTIKPDKTVDESKLSDRLSFYGISTTLYGAIDVNFNSNIVELAEGETVGMYYWTAEQYAAATGNLDVSVATYVECTREASQYTASIKNIAAKDADDVYYAVLVIRDAEGNDVEYSRTVAGSAEIYASIAVDYFNGQNVEDVAKAMLVYINEAAKYAAN